MSAFCIPDALDGAGVATPAYRSADIRTEDCLFTPLSSASAAAIGSSSLTGELMFFEAGLLRLESGEATSKTLGPTLS